MVVPFSKSASATRSPLSASAFAPDKSAFGNAQPLSLSRRASSSQLATAQQLGSFPGQATVKGSVGRGNPVDFMQVDLTANSRMRLEMTNRSGTRIQTVLLDASGQAVTLRKGRASLTVAGGEQGETVFRGLKTGTYYLEIKSAAQGTNRYQASLFVNRTGGPAPLPCGCGT